jgi:hypothetical protein
LVERWAVAVRRLTIARSDDLIGRLMQASCYTALMSK